MHRTQELTAESPTHASSAWMRASRAPLQEVRKGLDVQKSTLGKPSLISSEAQTDGLSR